MTAPTLMILILSSTFLWFSAAGAGHYHPRTSLATFNTELHPLRENGSDVKRKIIERADKIIQMVVKLVCIYISHITDNFLLSLQVNDSDVHVFCLQEVFVNLIQTMFRDELGMTYPHILSANNGNNGFNGVSGSNGNSNVVNGINNNGGNWEPACTMQNLKDFSNCILYMCLNLTREEQKDCIFTE